MKKILAILFAVISFVGIAFAQRNIDMTGRFIPPSGRTLLFGGQNLADCEEFVQINNGRAPAGFMFYVALSDLKGLSEINNVGTGDMSGDELLKRHPGAALQIGLYLVGSLKEVVDGDLDGNIKDLGKWIKKSNVPVFLRIGYEFDLPDNNYDPDLYKKAFIRIVEKMDSLNVKNVAFVWHSYAASNPRGIQAWYPGDEYVDWCAISYFAGNDWIPMVKFAKAHSKPLMIAESAPMTWYGVTDAKKPDWYRILFKFIEEKDVQAFCYINCNWDAQPMFEQYHWGNSKLNFTEEITKIWLANIANPRFIWLDNLYDYIKMPQSK